MFYSETSSNLSTAITIIYYRLYQVMCCFYHWAARLFSCFRFFPAAGHYIRDTVREPFLPGFPSLGVPAAFLRAVLRIAFPTFLWAAFPAFLWAAFPFLGIAFRPFRGSSSSLIRLVALCPFLWVLRAALCRFILKYIQIRKEVWPLPCCVSGTFASSMTT